MYYDVDGAEKTIATSRDEMMYISSGLISPVTSLKVASPIEPHLYKYNVYITKAKETEAD